MIRIPNATLKTYLNKKHKKIIDSAENNTKGGDAVLDLFAGSGTTVIACEQNGRDAYAMEFDPRYCDVIVKRWETLTGNRAVLLNDN